MEQCALDALTSHRDVGKTGLDPCQVGLGGVHACPAPLRKDAIKPSLPCGGSQWVVVTDAG